MPRGGSWPFAPQATRTSTAKSGSLKSEKASFVVLMAKAIYLSICLYTYIYLLDQHELNPLICFPMKFDTFRTRVVMVCRHREHIF